VYYSEVWTPAFATVGANRLPVADSGKLGTGPTVSVTVVPMSNVASLSTTSSEMWQKAGG